MPDEYELRFHPDFFDDLRGLNKNDLTAVYKQIQKIKQNPARFKHLTGVKGCYSVRVGNLRLVYYLEGKVIWFLIAEKRAKVYENYLRRLHRIKSKFA